MKILWVKAGKLLPVDTGGRIRSYHILKRLARVHEVTLLSYYGGTRDSGYEEELKTEFPGANVVHAAEMDRKGWRQVLAYLRGLFSAAPFVITKFTDKKVQRSLDACLKDGRFDVCVCDFLTPSLNFPNAYATPTILFQHNVETLLWKRMASTERQHLKRLIYKIEAAKMDRYERRTLLRFQKVIAVSDYDRKQMLAMAPSCQVSVVPTGVDTQHYAPAPPSTAEPLRIVFTGSMDWVPNIDAVIYFCDRIFPQVRAKFAKAMFQIVGRNPDARVKQLASDFVQVTGNVPSIWEYLSAATVMVVPLRIGGGTRLKIFEAMAAGKAVVSTTIGAEGLEVESGRDLILADDPVKFADAILLLASDATLRRRYEVTARQLAVRHDWSEIAATFAVALQTLQLGNSNKVPRHRRESNHDFRASAQSRRL